ncbi:hypothetical protein WR25_07574 [Diploscapter pachys]|uniref:Uncharacterized protein n=1 Tax=Diploscapter pachys TaxID=2018661 RepID=A0A2A2LQ99_9BILA|nr:hypothetical protein WR25_07574 [Diploscapter pachys]
MNQPLANAQDWQQWLILFKEGNNRMQEQHNTQNYLGNLLQRVNYCCDECIARFIELYSDMTTRRQADEDQQSSNSEEGTEIANLTGRFEESQRTLNTQLRILSTSFGDFETAIVTMNLPVESNGARVTNIITQFIGHIRNLQDHTSMQSNIKVDEVQEIKEQMRKLTVNLENIEFGAAQQQEEAIAQAQQKAQEAVEKLNRYSLGGAQIPHNCVDLITGETISIGGPTTSTASSNTTTNGVSSSGSYSMKGRQLFEESVEFLFRK